jgi:hypothetical protein
MWTAWRIRERLSLAIGAAQDRPHVLAVDVLHREEVAAVGDAGLVDARDVRMIEVRGELCLVEEQPHEARVLGVRRQDSLEHDESFCRASAREKQLRHPTSCELAEDLVRAKAHTSSGMIGSSRHRR